MKSLCVVLFLLIFSCENQNKKLAIVNNEDHAMIVSARKEASDIGLYILKKGGNAFDAMIATEFALSVSYPFSGSIGGGGFMVYRQNNGQVGSLDYREKAPLAAYKDMYLDEKENVIKGKSTLGAMAIGVPGMVDGMFEVHKKFGSLPMEEILVPVIELAKKGYIVTEKQSKRFEKYRDKIIQVSGDNTLYSIPRKAGDTLKNTALAQTLENIAKQGRNYFYKGELALKMAEFIQSQGGVITKADFEKYHSVWRDPIKFKYKDLDIISMAPPSSGGICLAQIMKIIAPYNIKLSGHNTLKTIQLLVEAERRAYADRSYYLGDPDFVKIPVKQLMSDTYLNQRMIDFTFDKASISSDISHGGVTFYESIETTHYSIVDTFGNAVSVTTTLNGAYGSKLFSNEFGFFLNNEMDDFSLKPGVPNMFGLIGNEANSIASEKRMLSSMTPTIIEKSDELYMVLGSPGGSTIITSVLQTILNVYEFGMTMQQAVDAPRFHHQWLPDVITFEPLQFDESMLKKLKEKGYQINSKHTPIIGKVDAILIRDKSLEGGADYRGDDIAVGF